MYVVSSNNSFDIHTHLAYEFHIIQVKSIFSPFVDVDDVTGKGLRLLIIVGFFRLNCFKLKENLL